jgi:hypothetical protein
VNSTYPFNVTAGNVTYTPSNDTSAPPDLLGDLNATQVSEVSSAIATATGAAGNVTTMKKRWLGQV